MPALTGFEIEQERERLEREAAQILGFMIFEYSRLEMELGLLLSWLDGGSSVERFAGKIGNLNFSKRLECLQKTADSKFREEPHVIDAYSAWISDANAIRELRNRLFHGRWGIEPIAQRVVNVVGLPNSPEQTSTPYTIPELEGSLEAIRQLRARLLELGTSYPS